MSQPDSHKFIFLCGLHRSGTSPLFRILREHPEISGFRNTGVPEDEGQHLQTVYPAAKVYGGPGVFGFAPEAHLTEQSDLINPDNRQRLFEDWSKHWDLTTPCLLEKSPPNLIRTRFLQALFPNSYFVVITRHPIAVSLATRKWADTSLDLLIEHWLHCHELFERDRTHLRRVLVLKYEDLIHDTGWLRQIYDFLGLALHDTGALDPNGNEPYSAAWRRLTVDPKGSAICRRLNTNYEARVRRHGYSLLDWEEGPPAAVSAGLGVNRNS